MTGQTSLLPPTATDERAGETDTAARCDDPTPRGVVRAALLETVGDFAPLWNVAASDHLDGLGFSHPGEEQSRVTRVLDVGAGYGAWSSELRRLSNRQGWPVHITGVELLYARRKHMRKWCDVSVTGHWSNELASMEEAVDAQGFDLVIGNPPFDELTGPKGAKLPPEECMPAVLLRHAPAVLLLHTQQAFLKSEAGRASWRHNPPAASWLVPGGVGFRGPGQGADSRCYQVTLWLRDHTGPCSVYMLPDLPAADRKWIIEPGTEQPSVCQTCEGRPHTVESDITHIALGRFGTRAEAVAAWKSGDPRWSGASFLSHCPDCSASGDPHGDLPAAPGYSP